MSGSNLLFWAIIFLVVAIVAGVFGFGGIAGTALASGKLLFWMALAIGALALLFGFTRTTPSDHA